MYFFGVDAEFDSSGVYGLMDLDNLRHLLMF